MTSILIAILSGIGFIVAYHTYGRCLARKIFRVDSQALVPSREMEDGIDYVPTRKEVLFGHHFTSIAGTGPIVSCPRPASEPGRRHRRPRRGCG